MTKHELFSQENGSETSKEFGCELRTNEDEWAESETEIADVVTEFYKELFKSSANNPDDVVSYINPKVTEDQKWWLTRQVTSEEIKDATFNLGAFKALGRDGFNGHFYQCSWEEVSGSV